MTKEEIGDLIIQDNVILLDTLESVLVKHLNLLTTLNIFWRHDTHSLLISKVTSKEYEEIRNPIDLAKKNILILNYKNKNHERVYKIEVTDGKIKLLELHKKDGYGLIVKIIDNQ